MKKFLLTGLVAGLTFMAQGAGAESLYKCEEKLDAERQTIMDAMESELMRSKDKLEMKTSKRKLEDKYYMSYSVTIKENRVMWGTYGTADEASMDRRFKAKEVFVRGEVRVGDYKDDGVGTAVLGIPSAGPYAIKRALWTAGDHAIKEAEENFYHEAAKEINEIKEEDLKNVAEFSKEKPNICMGNDVELKFEKEKLEGLVARVSAEFNDKEDILNSDVVIKASKVTNYFVNSEGTRLVTSSTFYRAMIRAELTAPDGSSMDTYRIFQFRTPNELPDEEQLKVAVGEVVDELRALRDAPKLGPATAPAILDSDNTGTFWHEVIGHRLEGHRQTDEFEGQTFRKKLEEKVTSDLVTLVDDPTLAKFNGKTLNGHYLFDNEGVLGQRAVLVEKGVLKGYMMSRSPIPKFSKSNGHGRSNGLYTPVSRMSNTMLIPEKSMPIEELKEMAKEEAINQGKDFYLIFKGSHGGVTSTMAFSTFQAFKTIPRLVYKVDVKTGEETLVRPVEVIGTPLNMLDEIVAFGDDMEAWNGKCGAESGWVPVSVVGPSMLVRRLEVQNMSKSIWDYFFGVPSTPPILPPPKP